MYAKALVQFIATVLAIAAPALISPSGIGWSEWINFGILVAGTVHVWNAANLPGYRYAKAVASGLASALVLLTSYLTSGISTSEWIQVAVAFVIGTAGVLAIRNSNTVEGYFTTGKHANDRVTAGEPIR